MMMTSIIRRALVTGGSDLGGIPDITILLNSIKQFWRFLFASAGILLNFLVMVVILRSRQLWIYSRYIFWLAIFFFNLLVDSVLVDFYLHQRADASHLSCQIYSFSLGCPVSLLLSATALAICDRYLAIVRPQIYQQHATLKNTLLLILGTVICVIAGHTFPYWMGYLPIKSGTTVSYNDPSWTLATSIHCFQAILSGACIAILLRLFLFVHRQLRPNLTTGKIQYNPYYHSYSSSLNINDAVNETDSGAVGNKSPSLCLEPVVDLDAETNNDFPFRLSVFPINLPHNRSTQIVEETELGSSHQLDQVCRLDLRAAKILSISILPFCITSLVLSIVGAALLLAAHYGQNNDLLLDYGYMMLMFQDFLPVCLAYNPAVFVAMSSEFRLAAGHFFQCRRQNPITDI